MQLIIIKGWTGNEEVISNMPTEETVHSLIYSLNWNDFNSVKLMNDNDNWVDISGNMGDDGLAIVYSENRESHISDYVPSSHNEIVKVLSLYLKNNENAHSIELPPAPPKVLPDQKAKYTAWKEKFETNQRLEKRQTIIKRLAAIVLLVLFGNFIYLWYDDELQFVGYETENTEAVVIETRWVSVEGGYNQMVTYEFTYQSESFKGSFRGTKFTGKHKKGDILQVKFAKAKPNRSNRMSTLKRN